MSKPPSGRTIAVGLVVILVLAALLRFYNSLDKGLWEWDAAFYANIAKAPVLTVRWAAANWDNLRSGSVGLGDLKNYLFNRGVSGFPGVKPGHTLLLALTFALLGVEDYAVQVMSAVFGLLVVALGYKLGRRFFGSEVGLVAAATLAVSGNQVYFSRSGYPQTDTVFFTLLGTYLYLGSWDAEQRWRWLLLAGISFSASPVMHQSAMVTIAVILLAELWRWWTRREVTGMGQGFRDLFALAAPVPVPFIAAEVIVRGFLHVSGWRPPGVGEITPLERNLSKAFRLFFAGEGAIEWDGYLQRMWELEGPVVCVLALLGLAVLVWQWHRQSGRTPQSVIIAAQFVWPLTFWTLSGVTTTMKAVQTVLPPMALLVGVGVWFLMRTLGRRRRWGRLGVLWLAIAAVLVWGMVNTWPLLPRTSGYGEAAERTVKYMETHGGEMTANQGSVNTLWLFYGGNLYDGVSSQVQAAIDLDTLERQGDFVVLDRARYTKPDKHRPLVEMVEGCQPVIVVPNPMAMMPLRFWPKQDRAMRAVFAAAQQQPGVDVIEVYDRRTCGGD